MMTAPLPAWREPRQGPQHSHPTPSEEHNLGDPNDSVGILPRMAVATSRQADQNGGAMAEGEASQRDPRLGSAGAVERTGASRRAQFARARRKHASGNSVTTGSLSEALQGAVRALEGRDGRCCPVGKHG